ncbi:hypothetical protein H920_02718 [Fukomys damarensis]|uniref:Uncharacterized protein n=1 Tax=Fukomys damarensis TaxID=885580 RepID=A0A091EK04_FUKDA|nr:hypothetical protein H920_02718 [Fukomys damarensis]
MAMLGDPSEQSTCDHRSSCVRSRKNFCTDVIWAVIGLYPAVAGPPGRRRDSPAPRKMSTVSDKTQEVAKMGKFAGSECGPSYSQTKEQQNRPSGAIPLAKPPKTWGCKHSGLHTAGHVQLVPGSQKPSLTRITVDTAASRERLRGRRKPGLRTDWQEVEARGEIESGVTGQIIQLNRQETTVTTGRRRSQEVRILGRCPSHQLFGLQGQLWLPLH